ncbi:MAG: peptidoglycan DD-metalloendopeptidase family protein [Candidatus Marinimicrobia bacterium]|nr:peptidoglycan DD-metalloendopeptidase family protein [Candidatus Neomarinimicrobiota bacterium]
MSIFSALCFAESVDAYDKKIDHGNERLKELEKQLNSLRSEVKKFQQQEQGLIREMDNTQRQISLTNEKIRLQKREMELRKAKKKQLQRDYQGAQKKSEELIDRYKKRVVHAYKLKPDRQLDLFIDAASPREFYYRIKYISAVNEADRELYNAIIDNINFIDTRNAQIDRETKAIAKNVKDFEQEQNNLKKLKKDKESKYSKISADKVLLAEQIKDKENSIKEIRNVIEKTQKDKKAYLARLEEERKKREVVELPFNEKKGKLSWPVAGRIISNFGKQKHPVLGTITENSGIDISASSGASVRAVSDGMIVTITWLRGFGNTIIVLHDNNYYSVYSHIENIDVIQDEYVDAGQKLATVSSDGSMNGTRLHFELWHEQEKLNPSYWLRK